MRRRVPWRAGIQSGSKSESRAVFSWWGTTQQDVGGGRESGGDVTIALRRGAVLRQGEKAKRTARRKPSRSTFLLAQKCRSTRASDSSERRAVLEQDRRRAGGWWKNLHRENVGGVFGLNWGASRRMGHAR
ncbi:hypothetical protein RSSM_03108 [Rhodopirellula sallentina SM41]|uniref:Uncharacterized protein n=1 Tax=Rhodopirellula sallentina SM41 TaxID=1263870 RepID=M5U201_9BACT|nr:hypothetical protein RSSM_03108 [Rhodopirellula sallentina SM41]